MSKPSPAKRARQQRRARAAAARRHRPYTIDPAGVQAVAQEICDDEAERLASLLVQTLDRWKQLPFGERVEAQCPFCSALVLVVNRAGDADLSHALPVCDLWLVGLTAVGSHSPRVTDGSS